MVVVAAVVVVVVNTFSQRNVLYTHALLNVILISPSVSHGLRNTVVLYPRGLGTTYWLSGRLKVRHWVKRFF
jgi:hypothetical protein